MTGMTKLINIYYAAGSRFCQYDQRVSLIQETTRSKSFTSLKCGQFSHISQNYIPHLGCMPKYFIKPSYQSFTMLIKNLKLNKAEIT